MRLCDLFSNSYIEETFLENAGPIRTVPPSYTPSVSVFKSPYRNNFQKN